METKSITHIKDLISQLQAQIDINVQIKEGQYGQESEYTHQEILDELTNLLIDLNVFVERPKIFLKITTYNQREIIIKALKGCLSSVSEPNALLPFVDSIKESITPLNTHTPHFSFILEEMRYNRDESDKILKTQQHEATSKLEVLNVKIANASGSVQKIAGLQQQSDEYFNAISALKSRFDEFGAKIDERENQLSGQDKEVSGRIEDLVEIFDKANDALKLTTTVGIGRYFQDKLDKLEDVSWRKKPTTYWLFGAVVSGVTAVGLGYHSISILSSYQGESFPDIPTSWFLARFSLLAFPIAATWFCAGQYTKIKNIAEDYGYKAVLVKSIVGFSEQLKNEDEKDTSYRNYIEKVLEEIHKHPLRNHKKHFSDSFLSLFGKGKKEE